MGRLVFSSEPIELTAEVSNAAIAHLPSDRIEQFFIQGEDRKVHRKDAQLDYRKDYENLDFTSREALKNLQNVTDYSIKTFPQFGSYGCFTMVQNGIARSVIRMRF